MEIIYRIFCEVLSAFKGFFQKKYNNNMRCRYFIFFMDFISYITSFLLFFFYFQLFINLIRLLRTVATAV